MFLYTGNLTMILPNKDSFGAQGLRGLVSSDVSDNMKGREPDLLLQAAKLYFMADRLDLPKLGKLATDHYQCSVYQGYKSPEFSTSLRLIFENTVDEDRQLKDVAIDCAAIHAKKLLNRKDFVALFTDKPEIGFEIFKRSLDEMKVESQGCPWYGPLHSGEYIEKQTKGPKRVPKKEWWCCLCRKEFDEKDLDTDIIA